MSAFWASRENEINNCGDVPHGGHAADERWIGPRVVFHFLRTSRAAIAAQVEQIHVVTARRDVVHPRCIAKLEIEGGACRIGRAVHEQDGALRPERSHVGRTLVTHVNLYARLRLNHELVDSNVWRLPKRLRSECRDDGGDQIDPAHEDTPLMATTVSVARCLTRPK